MEIAEFFDDILRRIFALPRKDEEWYTFFNHSFHIPKEELLKHGWDRNDAKIAVTVSNDEIIIKRI